MFLLEAATHFPSLLFTAKPSLQVQVAFPLTTMQFPFRQNSGWQSTEAEKIRNEWSGQIYIYQSHYKTRNKDIF